jgi:hypothetical protein
MNLLGDQGAFKEQPMCFNQGEHEAVFLKAYVLSYKNEHIDN